MKPLKMTLAMAAVWELLRFILLFLLVARLSGASDPSLPLLLMPLAAPALIVCAAFFLLALGGLESTILHGLLRMAKGIGALATAVALILAVLTGRSFALAQAGLLGGTIVLDLIFLFLLISYSGQSSSRVTDAAPRSDVDDGGRL